MPRCSDSLLGCWQITGVGKGYSNHALQEADSFKNVEFCLLECGSVSWKFVDNSEVPLASFTAFQMYEDRTSWNIFRLIRFSSWRGHILEFVVENYSATTGNRKMDLTLEGWGTLHCSYIGRLEKDDSDFEFNFSLALEDHLYTDFSIQLKNRTIEVNSFFVPENIRCMDFSELDEEIVNTMLFYLYNQALPTNITPQLSKKMSTFVDENEILPELSQLCKAFTKSVNIRNQFTKIVEDMRSAVNQVLTIFGGRLYSSSGQAESGRNKSAGRLIVSQPARLQASVKQTTRNILLVFLKIVQFCVRYEEVKLDLTASEQALIVKFGKARLFNLLSQLIELIKCLKYATVDLSSQSRQDLALYFVEEVEDIANFFTKLGDEFKRLLESLIEHTAVEREILSSQQEYLSSALSATTTNVGSNGVRSRTSSESGSTSAAGDVRSDDKLMNSDDLPSNIDDKEVTQNLQFLPKTIKTLRMAMLTKEILSLKRASDQLGYVFSYLKQEKDAFSQQPEQDRIRELSRQLEQLVDEMPLLLLTLERTSSRFQDNELLDDSSFLFEFTSQASSVFSVINHIRQNKDTFQPILELLRANCYQENIEQCLIELGLVNPPADLTNEKQDDSETKSNMMINSEVLSDLNCKFYESPKSRVSNLAELGYNLYMRKQDTDMIFELYQDTSPPLQFVYNTSTISSNTKDSTECDNKPDFSPLLEDNIQMGSGEDVADDKVVVTRIAAHRVIVCARCAWFQRALTSGMKEERERKIVLRDCSPKVFNIFLQFIYSGLYKLELNLLSVQTLVDLLLIADRYEVSVLVSACEEWLCSNLEDDNAIPLLILAEQFSTYRLRKECFEFIASRPDLLTAEAVEDLPADLRGELVSLHTWVRPNMFSERPEAERALLDSDHEEDQETYNIFS